MTTRKIGPSRPQGGVEIGKLADRLERAVVKIRPRYLKDWAGDEDMLASGEGHFKDLESIVALMRNGEVRKAADKANMLDTWNRENIPQTVWDFLYKYM